MLTSCNRITEKLAGCGQLKVGFVSFLAYGPWLTRDHGTGHK
jgi:hypothetical protein